MTQKETLYKEYIILHNKVNRLKDKEMVDESEDYFNSDNFKYDAKRQKVKDLTDSIKWEQDAYDREVYKLRVERYYNTEEGKARKEANEKALSRLYESRKENVIEFGKKLNDYIKVWLGEDWGCGIADRRNVNIGLVKETVDGYTQFFSGMSFRLSYDYSWKGKQNKTFEMNYESNGGFELLDEDHNNRKEFLLGMGNFVANVYKLKNLQAMLYNYADVLKEYDKSIRNLQDNIEHPIDEDYKVV